jgi:FtsP/CotA-like multicopper oxidase with cupredoxin domain
LSTHTYSPNRRGFAVLAALLVLSLVASGCSDNDASDATQHGNSTDPTPISGEALPVPPLLTGGRQGGVKIFRLDASQGQSSFIHGHETDTMGFNGAYLGPTLRVSEGDAVRMEVANHLGENTTVHWHGLHVPPTADGGPSSVIADGTSWTPQFTVRQQAASLWYHPHPMGRTTRQVGMGLAGMLIVDDDSAAQAALPHDYGVDDFPLILQSQYFDAEAQIVAVAESDTAAQSQISSHTVLTNGAVAPVLDTDQNQVRLRLLNASTTEFMTLSLSNGATLTQVASDGGLLEAPYATPEVRLAPAERAEVVLDVTGNAVLQATTDQGAESVGESDNADDDEDDADVEDGADDDADGGQAGAVDDSEAGTLFDILTIRTSGPTPEPADIPAQLNTLERLDTRGTDVRTVELTEEEVEDVDEYGIDGYSMTSMDDLNHTEHALHVTEGEVVVWDVHNATPNEHTLHVHDQQFQILSIDGQAPPAPLAGRKDTVPVLPDSTVRIAMRFTDYADPTTGYMFHCHVLPHEDGGMTSVLYVNPAT